MALIRPKEIRSMSGEERQARLKELRSDLLHERGLSSMGGAPASPGKIRALRKNVARLLTVIHEEEAKGGQV